MKRLKIYDNLTDQDLINQINRKKTEIVDIKEEMMALCSIISQNVERLNLAKSTLIDLEAEVERRSKKKK